MKNQPEQQNSLKNFFNYMLLGFLISSVRSNIPGIPLEEVVQNLFYTLMYNMIIGIWAGLSAMFGIDLYLYLKKNGSNEKYNRWFISTIPDNRQLCGYNAKL